jgi:hypothetical protein
MASEMNITEFQYHATRDIWDVDYVSTSDEEDNDSETEQDIYREEELKKELTEKSKEKKKKSDVVQILIEKDPDLVKRDLQARLYKISLWKKSRKRYGVLNEDYEGTEDFSWINYENDEGVYYAMGTKHKTTYKQGDQLFNCYGLRTNRFLLLNYGFCLRNNKYNSLGFKVFVNYQAPKKESPSKQEESDDSQYQKVIRLKKDKLSEDLLQYLRANLIFTYKGGNKEMLLVSSPVDIDFELYVVSCALNLMKNMRNTKYPTTLEQDRKMLAQIFDNWRFKLALIHRINQKEILEDQIKLLAILLRILARMKEGTPFKEAYSLRVADL